MLFLFPGKDMSQRNGFLPQIPTIPEILRQSGYYTAHSGKWHLGGMREEMRKDRVYNDVCNRFSPNQHGFEVYISELDGPESPRYSFLLQTLHTQGTNCFCVVARIPVGETDMMLCIIFDSFVVYFVCS